MNIVRITPDVNDFGDETVVFVTGIASIVRVSAGVVRESFYVEAPSSDGGDKIERHLVLTIIMDAEQWYAARGARAAVDPASETLQANRVRLGQLEQEDAAGGHALEMEAGAVMGRRSRACWRGEQVERGSEGAVRTAAR
jgi:hypothetical protein